MGHRSTLARTAPLSTRVDIPLAGPFGTDCEDCGPRCSVHPPPSPPPAPSPPLIAECACLLYSLTVSGDAYAAQGSNVGYYGRLNNVAVGGRSVYQRVDNLTGTFAGFYLYFSPRSMEWIVGPSLGGVHGRGDWAAITSSTTGSLCPGDETYRWWSDSTHSWVIGSINVACADMPANCVCENTCHLAGTQLTVQASDGLCDDGGPGAEWSDCAPCTRLHMHMCMYVYMQMTHIAWRMVGARHARVSVPIHPPRRVLALPLPCVRPIRHRLLGLWPSVWRASSALAAALALATASLRVRVPAVRAEREWRGAGRAGRADGPVRASWYRGGGRSLSVPARPTCWVCDQRLILLSLLQPSQP